MHHVAYKFFPGTLLDWTFGNGYVGVAFFFILSGFVLGWVHNDSTSLRQFYSRRFARIYPLHLVTAIFSIPVLLLLGMQISKGAAAANLLLVHAWIPLDNWDSSLNGASWSLSCEAFFYALFPALILLAQQFRIKRLAAITIGCLGVAAVVVLMTTSAEVAAELLYKGPWFRIGEFFIGVLLAVAIRRGYRSQFSLVTAVTISVGAYCGLSATTVTLNSAGVQVPRVVVDLAILPVACLLIAAAATADMRGKVSILTTTPLIRLGEASFALYMFHYLLLEFWGQLPLGSFPVWASAVAAICVSVIVSLVAHKFLEQPAERFLRSRLVKHA